MIPLRLQVPSVGPGLGKAIDKPQLVLPRAPRLVVATLQGGPPSQLWESVESLFAAVDWGDNSNYGEDVSPPSVERRAEALAFLRRLASVAVEKLGTPLPLPEVSPTMDGDIDLHWGAGQARELLLCVRSGGIASFFGMAADGQTIKGVVRTDAENAFLATWLA
jgi:hypothetical protein